MRTRERFVIAQLSDLHFGDPRFDPALAERCLELIASVDADLVAVPGDLTAAGYPEEFEAARAFLDRIPAPFVVVPGNHDERNVGWQLYERTIGDRWSHRDVDFGVPHGDRVQKTARIVCADSAKPDLDDGEVGRNRYSYIRDHFLEVDHSTYKVFVVHHHLVTIPGTGRERNIVWDAGDLLEVLLECGVDVVLAGHKHVPWVWEVNGLTIVTSGTATTRRTRGATPPSMNLVEVTPDEVRVTVRGTAEPIDRAFTVSRVAHCGVPRVPADLG